MMTNMEVSPDNQNGQSDEASQATVDTSDSIAASVREQWLDKLWYYLFDGNNGGLVSPGQIRREHRDRDRVRQVEMAAILEAEEEINGIHQGLKELDDNGNLVDTPPVDSVATHRIIENTSIEQDLDIGLDTPAKMIRSVVKEISVRDLERSLNIRKLAILAESEIVASAITAVSSKPVNAEWMVRWRESAENVFNPELQILWARVLVQEIAQPDTFSLAVMTALRQLNREDLEMVLIVAKYAFPEFIYNAADSYFNTDHHRGLFDVMEDLGLLSAHGTTKKLSSTSSSDFELMLQCRNKALKISASNPNKQLQLPMLRLSRIGRQLFSLMECEVDLAYLFDLAGACKAQGFSVALGDWEASTSKGRFIEKMSL